MKKTKYSITENLFLLHSFINRRETILPMLRFGRKTPLENLDAIQENHITDLEMLSHFATSNPTPRIVNELHVRACKESGITECICLTYKDATTPQRGDIL